MIYYKKKSANCTGQWRISKGNLSQLFPRNNQKKKPIIMPPKIVIGLKSPMRAPKNKYLNMISPFGLCD